MGSSYTPNAAAMKRLEGVDFVAVIGPTAAGKTTLINEAMAADPKLQLVTVTTSRAARPGERDGIDYHFRSEEEMRARIAKGEFVQVAPNAFGALYATLPEDYTHDGVAIMAVIVQAMPDFLRMPFKRLRQIFILPPRLDTWRERMSGHGFSAEQLSKRMAEARRSLEYAATSSDVLFVCNEDLAVSTAEFKRILAGEKPHIGLQEGHKIAKQLLTEL